MKIFDTIQLLIGGVLGVAALIVIAQHSQLINDTFTGIGNFTSATFKAAGGA